ncbi:hypothetical protein H490_0104035 [Leucobacter sp. UCD-THU]|uniref:hypothetical protein n=1 Tax=Leucobacter sp. UCD-THU TaxID=1292023 RepID=UPI000377F341|nr:hypothetical protein [Leucobacter sp. UCD-THU]EYT56043.1 hypothetical protein H490_0104035 [Leucobacter sp. UCD-THU]
MQIARQRWLPPSDFTDPQIGSLPAQVRVTAAGLRLYVDDWGRAEVRLRRMLAEIYEHDEQMTEQLLAEHLGQLSAVHWLRLYVDDRGRSLLQIRVWPAVQHPDPRGSAFPPPEGFMKPSRTSQETFTVEARARASACAGEGAWERESASERAGAGDGTPSRTPDSDAPRPPSPFCSQHQPWGTEEPCGPCRTTRMAFEIWQTASKYAALSTPAAAPPGPRFEAAPEPEEYLTDDGRIEHT